MNSPSRGRGQVSGNKCPTYAFRCTDERLFQYLPRGATANCYTSTACVAKLKACRRVGQSTEWDSSGSCELDVD